MKKKLIASALILTFVMSFTGCKRTMTEQNESKATSTEESKEGYKRYQDVGVEFKKGDLWKKYDDNLSLSSIGDPENENEQIYNGLFYEFLANEQLKEYEEAQKITDENEKKKKINEIFGKARSLFKFVVFKKEKAPADDKIQTITQCKNNDKLGEKDKYVFYFSYNDYDSSGLSEEGKKMYKELYDDMKNIKESTKVFKPITPQEAFNNIGKIEFKLKDLNGKDFESSEIFKENKLTMINIWATFCGPCKREMPDLAKLYEEIKDEKVNIIGIIGDTPDQDNEVAAAKIIETKGVKYLNLIPDKKFAKDIIGSIAGYPTTIFVDSKGKVVGNVITGEQSKDNYKKSIEEILKTIK